LPPRVRGGGDQTRAARRTHGDISRDRGTAARTRGSLLGEEVVELRDILVPRDVIEERAGGGPQLLGRVRFAQFLRLDPQLGDLDLSFVGSGRGRPVESRHRLAGPTRYLRQPTPR